MDIIQELDEETCSNSETCILKNGGNEEEGEWILPKKVDSESLEVEKTWITESALELLEKQVKRVSEDDADWLKEIIGSLEEIPIEDVEPAPTEIVQEIQQEEKEADKIDRNALLTEIKELQSKTTKLKKHNVGLQILIIHEMARNRSTRARLRDVITFEDEKASSDPVIKGLYETYSERLQIYVNELQENSRIKIKYKSDFQSMRDAIKKGKEFCDDALSNLCEREIQIGQYLKSSKTGREIPEKYLSRLINRQIQSWRTLASSRVTYFRNRDRTSAMEEQVAKRETIADGLTISLYETMTLAKLRFCDRMEERDEELARLREQCRSDMLITAHMREKAKVLEADTETGKEQLQELQAVYKTIRGRVAKLHHKRVEARKQMEATKNRAGLLLRKPLLCDYSNCVTKVEQLKIQVDKMKKDYFKRQEKLRIMRAEEIKKSSHAVNINRKTSQMSCSLQHFAALKLPPIKTRKISFSTC